MGRSLTKSRISPFCCEQKCVITRVPTFSCCADLTIISMVALGLGVDLHSVTQAGLRDTRVMVVSLAMFVAMTVMLTLIVGIY